MAKLLILLIALTMCCFTTSCNKDITLEIPDTIATSVSPISVQEKNEIETTWVSQTGYSFFWYSDDHLDGLRYYGKYNGYIVLFKPKIYIAETFVIFGNYILTSQKEFDIYAFKDGVLYGFQTVYEEKIISDQAMKDITMIHDLYEKEIEYLSKPVTTYTNENVTVPHLKDRVKNEIEAAYINKKGVSLFYPSDSLSRGVRYYGNYKGYEILFVPTALCSTAIIEIAECRFTYPNRFNLYAYKDGVFHKLENIYQDGMISSKDVYKIAELHYFMNKQEYSK